MTAAAAYSVFLTSIDVEVRPVIRMGGEAVDWFIEHQ